MCKESVAVDLLPSSLMFLFINTPYFYTKIFVKDGFVVISPNS